jgi:hypothetical protein
VTFARDLSDMRAGRHPYYVPIPHVRQLAVGWLEESAFEVRLPSDEFLAKLKRWVKAQPRAWGPLDAYSCSFAPSDEERDATGSGDIYVPHHGERATLFVAPRLIAHYVEAHHYAPPEEFVASVLACPLSRIPRISLRFVYVWENDPSSCP